MRVTHGNLKIAFEDQNPVMKFKRLSKLKLNSKTSMTLKFVAPYLTS